MKQVLLVAALASCILLSAPSGGAPRAEPAPSADTPPDDRVASFLAGIARDPSAAILVPAGAMLEGRATEDGFVFSAVPLPAPRAPMDHPTGDVADCNNDVPLSTRDVATNDAFPFAANTASRGECVREYHAEPIHVLQFQTSGDYWGWVTAYDNGDQNGISVGCGPTGSIVGAGVGDEWRTTFDGQDTYCYVEKWGAEPSEFTSWFAVVTNYNWHTGATYASFY